MIKNCVSAVSNDPFPQFNLFRSISHKLETNYNVLVKTDKGEALVALTSTEYHQKMVSFLTSSGAVPSTLNYNSYNKSIRQAVHDSKFILPDQNVQDAVLAMNLRRRGSTASLRLTNLICLSDLSSLIILTPPTNWPVFLANGFALAPISPPFTRSAIPRISPRNWSILSFLLTLFWFPSM